MLQFHYGDCLGGGIPSYLQDILEGGGGGDSVLVNKKERKGILSRGDFVLHFINRFISNVQCSTVIFIFCPSAHQWGGGSRI